MNDITLKESKKKINKLKKKNKLNKSRVKRLNSSSNLLHTLELDDLYKIKGNVLGTKKEEE